MKRWILTIAVAAVAALIGVSPAGSPGALAQGAWQPPSPPPPRPQPPPPAQPVYKPPERKLPSDDPMARQRELVRLLAEQQRDLNEAKLRAERVERASGDLHARMAKLGAPPAYQELAGRFARAAGDFRTVVGQLDTLHAEITGKAVEQRDPDLDRKLALGGAVKEAVQVLKSMERLQEALARTAIP